MSETSSGSTAAAPDHDPRSVLQNTAFRRLWIVLGLSSFGDWLGLLAILGFAFLLGGSDDGTLDPGDLLSGDLAAADLVPANLAVAAVLVLRLAPAVLLGPLAGVIADRIDRRLNLVVGDVVRFALFLSIPLVGTLTWLFVATVLIEVAALFWAPAKDAMVPNLVPREQLEAANQLGVIATYGTAPLAAVAFTLLTLLHGMLDNVLGPGAGVLASPVDLALYANAATFLVAAVVVARLPLPEGARGRTHTGAASSVWLQITEGWGFIARTPDIRGLVLGMVGAFAAGGFVIGLGISYVAGLGAGLPGYGVLFGAVFVGMVLGVWQGPRTLRDMSRRRLFATAIGAAGGFLVVVGLSPNIVLSAFAVVGLGFAAGVAWVTGMTLLGGEVDDALRGRTFAFVQSAVRVVLVAVMALAPLLAAGLGQLSLRVTDSLTWTFSGAGLVFVAAGLFAVVVGVVTFRHMDDRRGTSLRAELVDALRRGTGDPLDLPRPHDGFFLAIEGGDGSGKSTLVAGLDQWLQREIGHEVLTTREPGGTPMGRSIRQLLLDLPADPAAAPVPRAEALLFAADRAQHVATVIRPALDEGTVVVTDRYVDSSLAYQGARGDLERGDVAMLSRWATEGLQPDLTVVLDIDPDDARHRLGARDGVGAGDRLEAQPEAFHVAVRQQFLDRARSDPARYLVLDATLPPEQILTTVGARLRRMLPLSPRQLLEAADRLAQDAAARQARESAATDAAAREMQRREEVWARLRAEQERQDRLAAETRAAQEALRQRRVEEAAEARDREDTVVVDARAVRARQTGDDTAVEQDYFLPFDEHWGQTTDEEHPDHPDDEKRGRWRR